MHEQRREQQITIGQRDDDALADSDRHATDERQAFAGWEPTPRAQAFAALTARRVELDVDALAVGARDRADGRRTVFVGDDELLGDER